MNRWNCVGLIGALTLSAWSLGLQAQTVYRIVGADGRVTFSDKPPTSEAQGKVSTANVGAGAGPSTAGLPFELRQVMGKYPVTLYTSANCAPCNAGRALLSGRGVPFSERTISTQEDAAALQRLSGDASVPFVTIGGQRIKGFSDAEWTQYLDAAGYPKVSQLPSAYRSPAPSPLVSTQKPAVPSAEPSPAPEAPRPAAPAPSGDNPSNPAGITF